MDAALGSGPGDTVLTLRGVLPSFQESRLEGMVAHPRRRTLHLTAQLVARVERIEPDCGPDPDMIELTDDEYDQAAVRLLTEASGAPVWLFAYGSLIWKPDHDHEESRRVQVYGWRRAFSIPITRWRATPEQPGLMLALARGGACHGMAYRLRTDDLHGQLLRLLDREVGSARGLSAVRWVKCRCANEEFRALAFYVQNGDDMFVHLPIEEQARRLARAAGQWGSGASYLHNTIVHLEELGIHDSYLWRLQRLVAAEISAMPPLAAP